jgi:transposase
VIETDRPVAHVAAEINVGEQLLGRWVRLARAADDAGDTGAVLDADERAELERLRRENAELRLDREFLKKVRHERWSRHEVGRVVRNEVASKPGSARWSSTTTPRYRPRSATCSPPSPRVVRPIRP